MYKHRHNGAWLWAFAGGGENNQTFTVNLELGEYLFVTIPLHYNAQAKLFIENRDKGNEPLNSLRSHNPTLVKL